MVYVYQGYLTCAQYKTFLLWLILSFIYGSTVYGKLKKHSRQMHHILISCCWIYSRDKLYYTSLISTVVFYLLKGSDPWSIKEMTTQFR